MNIPGGLHKFLMSLGPDAVGFAASAGKGAGRVGKKAFDEGVRVASEYPKTALAGGGLLGALGLSQLLGDEEEDEYDELGYPTDDLGQMERRMEEEDQRRDGHRHYRY